jgi:sugar phosphate permease
MTDLEKTTANTTAGATPDITTEPEASNENDPAAFTRPKGWMYKSPKLGSFQGPWFASPKMQLFLVSLVCFLCPGMFNAVNGLGAGGQVDAKPSDNALTALYATFSVVGFFAGTFANRLGIRITLSFGGFGYGLYVSSLLCYNHTQNAGFLIFAGAMLGVCAGLLWTAQGAIMMSYPPENSKGRYISWFWMIFNMGAVIGSLVSFPFSRSLAYETYKNDFEHQLTPTDPSRPKYPRD